MRNLQPCDAEAVFRYRSDPEVSRFQNWEPKSLQEVQSFISEQADVSVGTPGQWCQFGLYLNAGGHLIGDCGIHVLQADPRQAEVGITLSPAYQGRGYATEALTGLLGYLFNDLAKHRVFASVDPRNEASLALLTRVGMRREAHFRQSLWFKGGWADDVVFGMLSSEFQGGS